MKAFCLTAISLLSAAQVCAGYLEDIRVDDLRARDGSLNGAGVTVAQVEAPFNGDEYQTHHVNVNLDSSIFTYYDSVNPWSAGGASFDSSRESVHANIVGGRFFDDPDGVAPGVAAIQVFEAGHFYNDLLRFEVSTNAKVVNQSFVFLSQSETVDRNYDDYAAFYNVLFVNGINTNNNPATLPSPGSSYNGITVGVVDGPITPLSNNRSKPDIVAPGSTASSFTTPLVSGAAAVLIQSALREDAGSGTETDASDIRTLKALILNSATKRPGWSNSPTQPLDRPNGAGTLNVNEAQLQLAAGQYSPTVDEHLTEAGTGHLPPGGVSSTVSSNTGWALGTVTNTSQFTGFPFVPTNYDVTDHYFFELDNADADAFYLTSTLVWNRQRGRSSINNLNLFLYKEDGTLVAESVSSVDNVEHLYQRHLSPGRYVLQVHKPYNDGRITNAETYALAFSFTPAPVPGAPGNIITTTVSTTEIDLSWTDTSDDETGYRVLRSPDGASNFSILDTLNADATSFSDTGLTSGTTYDYQVVAYNAETEAASPVIPGSTTLSIEDWRQSFFGTTQNSGDAADDFDFDSDTVVNLLEFTTGSDPKVASPPALDRSLLGSDGHVSFNWRIGTSYDFSIGYSSNLTEGFTYYTSAQLESGSSTELELIRITDPDSDDGLETRTYGIRDTVTDPSIFLRLRVQ